MRIFQKAKDGGPSSPVDAYFLFEIKWLGSIAILKFNKGAREAFHTHAFGAWTWFISGDLQEELFDGTINQYKKSFLPKYTKKDNNHRVKAQEDSYCFTMRGPWEKFWTEDNKETNIRTAFTNHRVIVSEVKV